MRIRKVLFDFDMIIASFSLAMLWGNIILQVTLRQIFSRPIMVADELTMYLVAAVIITPLGCLEKENGHIVMEEFLNILPSVIKKTIRFIISVSVTAIYIMLVVSVSKVIINNPRNMTPMLKMPFWFFFMPCVIGFLWTSIVRVIKHICFLTKKELPWA